jgi:hypothetical protein
MRYVVVKRYALLEFLMSGLHDFLRKVTGTVPYVCHYPAKKFLGCVPVGPIGSIQIVVYWMNRQYVIYLLLRGTWELNAKGFALYATQIESAIASHKGCDCFKLAVNESGVIADDRDSDDGDCLTIIMVYFRNGCIKAAL